MKNFLIIFLVNLLIMCSSSSTVNSVDEGDTIIDPFKINSKLYPGINLGNALEAPNEGDWGVTIKDEYLRIIKDAGFNSVRIPIRWSAHTEIDTPYTLDYSFLARVKHVIDEALKNNLTVVINIHHFEEIFQNPEAQHDKFLSIWEQVSRIFKDYPESLVFEILNEPHDNFTAELWNEYFPEAIEVIRRTNPDRTLIVGTAGWGGISALNDLEIPNDEQNLIITVHYYEPFHFTHQGAEWSDGSEAWLGTTWSATFEEVTSMKNHFDQIDAWAIENNRPIYIGEFGAYYKADMYSRHLWTGYVVNQCQQHNFSWAYWEFCSGFGAWNPESKTWNQALLSALIQN